MSPETARQSIVQGSTGPLPIEDLFCDILNKAQRGQRLTIEELSERSGVPIEVIQEIKNGSNQLDVIEKLAFVLNLHATCLTNLANKTWYPRKVDYFPGLAMFTTHYGDMTVNSFIVWDPETCEAASFDTGSSCQQMLAFIQANGLQLKRIFITHTHMDHLADLGRLQTETEAPSYGSAVENPLGLRPLVHGDGFILGNLRIRVIGTSGHTPGGLSFFIHGLKRPVVIVGDALFAGSMGGAAYAYHEALFNNVNRILSLPDNTVICPGHGPMTSVEEEKENNPFFPEFK